MGKFNEYLNKKIVPIPSFYKNPYFGVLKDLFSKENKGETVIKKYVKTQLNTDYLNTIKNDIYEHPLYAEALEPPMLQDLKNIYLKTPQTFNSVGISKYRPKNGTQPYYFNSKILDTVGAGIVVKAGDNLKRRKTVPTDKLEDINYGELSHITPNNNAVTVLPGLGHSTIGIGHDKKGEYISYYDDWNVGNFKPNTKHLIDFFNKSVPVYGRVYLDDYYDIPEEAKGNPFITPSVVTAYKKGGRIHIKKKNRGSFTRWCKGKVTEECIRRGKNSSNPAIRKKATFAANVRKWKHQGGGPLGRPNFKESKESYYDPETDTIFAPDSLGEFYHHEMFHARPNTQLLELLKPYYHNLNDDILKEMGADLSFVKRFNNDPGHFYSPEELGARVISASEMLNRMGVKDVTLDFLKNARLNENAYGDNFRDLLHMYNDENLIKIFNIVKKHENGGILKAQEGTGNLHSPHPLSPIGIALNQAKAMAKMKGEQQHLPPGVKEVVGLDGNKVVIRTEQPLKSLEQSIAEWLPGTGDIAEFGHITNDLKKGRYGTAIVGAGLLLIPGAFGKLLNKYRKTVRTADNIEDAVRKANTAEYINTIDDVTLDPFSITEVPEKAFIPKEKEVIQLSPTHTTKEKEKFVEDVVTGAYFARKNPVKTPALKEFKTADNGIFLEGMPVERVGAESAVYMGKDVVYKSPKHIRHTRIIRSPNSEIKWVPVPEFKDIQSIKLDADTYLGDLNKYWFQEPTSLEGYFKWSDELQNGTPRYLPVYSQPKGIRDLEYDDLSIKELKQYEYLKDKIHKSNIFLENDLPVPHDTHMGNFMVFPDGVVRAVDIHKDGGKL